MRRCLWRMLIPVVAACADPGEPLPPGTTKASFANQIVFPSLEAGVWRLHTMDVDGSNRRMIPIALKGHLTSPDVSPDGRKVAFVHERAIYIVRPDGSDLRRLTQWPLDDRHVELRPRWSPDGSELAFSGARTRGSIDLYTIGADGSGPRRLTFGDDLFMGSWSPDGLRLAFTVRADSGARVGIVRRDGSSRLELPPLATDDPPDWSPDGLAIAYQSFSGRAIHVIGVDGSNDRRITPDGMIAGLPRWSPDGRQIMFLSIAPEYGIMVSRADGSERRQLTWELHDSEPVWGPAE